MHEVLTNPEPLYVAAATATGKSAVALELAEMLPAEIINADAFQLYAGLGICTAQPAAEEQQRVPHHLYGVLSPTQSCDAAQYAELARPVIAEVLARGKWPILVGGSGLYLKALTHGLADVPKGDAALRAELAARSAAERVAWLLRLDPEAERNVPLANDRYVSRALEVCLLTGQPQSLLRTTWTEVKPFLGVLLERERADLVERISLRTKQMAEGGLVQELRNLLAEHSATPEQLAEVFPTAHKAIGVLQVARYLRGGCSLDEALAEMALITRQYAKRQRTWFRREHGFQTICLTPDSSPQYTAHRLPHLFPCLSPFLQHARSSLT